MTIHTKRLKNGQFKVTANEKHYTSSCTNKNKKTAYERATQGLWGLLDIKDDRLINA